MSQDEVSRLSDDIKSLTETVQSFKESFAASDALQRDHIERLERSDSEQWHIIRDTHAKLMRYAFFVTGVVSALGFFGILDKIRVLLAGP
jgi:uncharacterized coiled-coil protein SlyX